MPRISKPKEMWFEWPDDQLGGRILVRHLKEGDIVAIHSKCSSADTSYVDGNSASVTSRHDMGLERELVAVAAIAGWENFFDESGKPLECTAAHKRLFAMEDGFYGQLRKFRNELTRIVDEAEEKAKKN